MVSSRFNNTRATVVHAALGRASSPFEIAPPSELGIRVMRRDGLLQAERSEKWRKVSDSPLVMTGTAVPLWGVLGNIATCEANLLSSQLRSKIDHVGWKPIKEIRHTGRPTSGTTLWSRFGLRGFVHEVRSDA